MIVRICSPGFSIIDSSASSLVIRYSANHATVDQWQTEMLCASLVSF